MYRLQGHIAYRGLGLAVPVDSELVFTALSASPTAYSGVPGQALAESPLAGTRLALVALMQASACCD
jgi:hypothetical protein